MLALNSSPPPPPPTQAQAGTFSHQRSLPRLPIPPLRQTAERYLKSLEPFIADKGNGKDELKKHEALVEDFVREGGIGVRLQERLHDLDKVSPNNWLNDTIWTRYAYHEWRSPLLINSNWWLLFQDDMSVPENIRRSESDGVTAWQVRRGAWLVNRFLEYRELLKRGEIHPDTSRTGQWFRKPALRLFSLTRIPLPSCDALTNDPPPSSSRHIVIMLKERMYAVDVLDWDDAIITVAEIERRIWDVVRDAEAREHTGDTVTPVGRLTADHRDRWTANREHLLSLSPRNRESITKIERSILVLSLVAHTLPANLSNAHPEPSEPSPIPDTNPLLPSPRNSTIITNPYVDAHLRSIEGGVDGTNRWFDKAFNLIVESNSRAGLMGEHSPCDALIPSMIADWALGENIDTAEFEVPTPSDAEITENPTRGFSKWERIDWVVDAKIEAECRGAKERAHELMADSDVSELWFGEYGADWMKQTAKISPDAYIQMALQLAWYKDQGYFTATYETASTRLFLHGRTETIRTLSGDSRAFVDAALDPSVSPSACLALLRAATNTHNNATRDAATGKGIDRHLLGLQLMVRKDETMPALFEDELFKKSQEWKLSTSGLSAGGRFKGTGFGSVYPDGYGINYLAGPYLLKFGIESKDSCPTTSTRSFKEKVVESLCLMRDIVEQGEKQPTVGTSKL